MMRRVLSALLALIFALTPIAVAAQDGPIAKAALGQLQAKRPLSSPVSTLMSNLTLANSGQGAYAADVAVITLSDSTGFGDDRWQYRLLANDLAPAFPNVCVLYREWDTGGTTSTDVTRDYGPWRTISCPAAGPSYIQFVSGTDTATRQLTAAEVGAITSGSLQGEVDVALANWQAGTEQDLVSQFATTTGNKAFRFYISTANKLTLGFSCDGNAETAVSLSTANTYTAGQRVQLKFQITPNNGGGGYTYLFASRTPGTAAWTNLASQVGTTGACSLNTASTAPYEIGGRGLLANAFGKFYEVFIRDGVATSGYAGGPVMNPQPITVWQRYNSGAASGSIGGATTLRWNNGARSGENIAYFDAAIRFKLMAPPFMGAAVILNTGHNEAGSPGSYSLNRENLTGWAGLNTDLKARLPAAAFAMTTQNPRIAPDTEGPIEANRVLQQAMWGYQNGWTVFDTYRAFVTDPRFIANPTVLINPDIPSGGLGVHPTGAGSQLYADTVWGYLNDRLVR